MIQDSGVETSSNIPPCALSLPYLLIRLHTSLSSPPPPSTSCPTSTTSGKPASKCVILHSFASHAVHVLLPRPFIQTKKCSVWHPRPTFSNTNISTEVAILNFSKALSTVSHKKNYYINWTTTESGALYILDSQTSWPRGKKMRVVLEGKASEEVSVNSGVSQGTVFGPLLFLCHINGLYEVNSAPLRSFFQSRWGHLETSSTEPVPWGPKCSRLDSLCLWWLQEGRIYLGLFTPQSPELLTGMSSHSIHCARAFNTSMEQQCWTHTWSWSRTSTNWNASNAKQPALSLRTVRPESLGALRMCWKSPATTTSKSPQTASADHAVQDGWGSDASTTTRTFPNCIQQGPAQNDSNNLPQL